MAVLGIATIGGCGGDEGDSTARETPKFSAASERATAFVERMTNLLATTSAETDCAALEAILARSFTDLSCPVDDALRKSMARFEVVGAEEYGTGAVIDYRSGDVEDGAAILLFVAKDRNWAVSRFGVLTEPSTEKSDERSRAGYDKAIDDYLAAVRERDCEAFQSVAFTGEAKPKEICDTTFAATKDLAQRLKASPSAEPKYAGGNATYGFYTLETQRPRPLNSTISVMKVPSGPDREPGKDYVVLDVAPSPTAAEQRLVIEQFRKQQRQKDDQPKRSPSLKAS